MSDWQVGDLALCVKSGIYSRAGAQYNVSDVWLPGEVRGDRKNKNDVTVLWFVEFDKMGLGQKDWAGADRFVKITPPAADEFDRETIELMNRVGQPA